MNGQETSRTYEDTESENVIQVQSWNKGEWRYIIGNTAFYLWVKVKISLFEWIVTTL
jgi:hypothetical protein